MSPLESKRGKPIIEHSDYFTRPIPPCTPPTPDDPEGCLPDACGTCAAPLEADGGLVTGLGTPQSVRHHHAHSQSQKGKSHIPNTPVADLKSVFVPPERQSVEIMLESTTPKRPPNRQDLTPKYNEGGILASQQSPVPSSQLEVIKTWSTTQKILTPPILSPQAVPPGGLALRDVYGSSLNNLQDVSPDQRQFLLGNLSTRSEAPEAYPLDYDLINRHHAVGKPLSTSPPPDGRNEGDSASVAVPQSEAAPSSQRTPS